MQLNAGVAWPNIRVLFQMFKQVRATLIEDVEHIVTFCHALYVCVWHIVNSSLIKDCSRT